MSEGHREQRDQAEPSQRLNNNKDQILRFHIDCSRCGVRLYEVREKRMVFYLVRFSAAVIDNMAESNLGEERVYFSLQSQVIVHL